MMLVGKLSFSKFHGYKWEACKGWNYIIKKITSLQKKLTDIPY